MRVQAAILMDHDDARQLRNVLRACVGADRPNKISLDASIALRGGYGFVAGFDPVVGARDLLAQRIIWHQCTDHRCHRDTARESLHAVYECAAADFSMNKV